MLTSFPGHFATMKVREEARRFGWKTNLVVLMAVIVMTTVAMADEEEEEQMQYLLDAYPDLFKG